MEGFLIGFCETLGCNQAINFENVHYLSKDAVQESTNGIRS